MPDTDCLSGLPTSLQLVSGRAKVLRQDYLTSRAHACKHRSSPHCQGDWMPRYSGDGRRGAWERLSFGNDPFRLCFRKSVLTCKLLWGRKWDTAPHQGMWSLLNKHNSRVSQWNAGAVAVMETPVSAVLEEFNDSRANLVEQMHLF